MITVRIFKDSDGSVRGFRASGHAGLAQSGRDVVCAAVSVLLQNTVNSIETFTQDEISYSADEGFLEFLISGKVSDESSLLLNSMVLGLESIEESAVSSTGTKNNKGRRYLQILTEEV